MMICLSGGGVGLSRAWLFEGPRGGKRDCVSAYCLPPYWEVDRRCPRGTNGYRPRLLLRGRWRHHKVQLKRTRKVGGRWWEAGTGGCVCNKLLGRFSPWTCTHNVDQNKDKAVGFRLRWRRGQTVACLEHGRITHQALLLAGESWPVLISCALLSLFSVSCPWLWSHTRDLVLSLVFFFF